MRGGRRTARKGKDGKILPPAASKGPTLARHINFALPWGAPPAARIAIAREFAQWIRAEFNCAGLLAVHNKTTAEANDGHLVISDREVDSVGNVGRKIRALNSIETKVHAYDPAQPRSENEGGACEKIRAKFADICNEALRQHGAPTITHKSYERQGLSIVPQKKRSRTAEMKAARISAGAIVRAKPLQWPANQIRKMRDLRKKRMAAEHQRQRAESPYLHAISVEIADAQTAPHNVSGGFGLSSETPRSRARTIM